MDEVKKEKDTEYFHMSSLTNGDLIDFLSQFNKDMKMSLCGYDPISIEVSHKDQRLNIECNMYLH